MKIKQKTIAFTTLGCRTNQYDTTAIEEMCKAEGYTVVPFTEAADGYVINTCTVTNSSDAQSRQVIRQARRRNSEAVILVTGCYAQVSPDEVVELEEVDYVIANSGKDKVLEYIKKGRNIGGKIEDKLLKAKKGEGASIMLRAHNSDSRTRINLKVQDGCNKPCTFCIIPVARGNQVSLPLEEVHKDINILIGKGFREMVLTGIHIGAFGKDLRPKTNITNLIKDIESRQYDCRFRISSLDPDEVNSELVDILKNAKTICNHLHLPVQSCDDYVLERMKRPYTGRLFADKVELLAREVKNISIGTDVIVGFPGEGEKEFENTYNMIENLPLSYLHIFPYSDRRGTPAEGYDKKVNPKVIKERCRRLKELDNIKRKEFYDNFIGTDMNVLVESTRAKKSGLLRGRTSNYIPVEFDGSDSLMKEMVIVNLKDSTVINMLGVNMMDKNTTSESLA